VQRTQSNSNKNAEKTTELIDFPPLITVWLQVRVLPGPPHKIRHLSDKVLCRAAAALQVYAPVTQ
jgi:hypothetical protein